MFTEREREGFIWLAVNGPNEYHEDHTPRWGLALELHRHLEGHPVIVIEAAANALVNWIEAEARQRDNEQEAIPEV